MSAPIEKGDEVKAEFADLGQKGDPIFHYGESDFVIFVDQDAVEKMDANITIGQKYELVITKVQEKCAFASPRSVYDKFLGGDK